MLEHWLFIPGFGSDVISLTESEWELLEEYNAEATYSVKGVGIYKGATLFNPAAWAPAAQDLHVSKTGNDANPGTQASPKLTIWGAFNSISLSNATPITVWVDEGTYDENVASTGYFLFTKNFLNMVTVRGKPGTLPIVRNVSGLYVIRPHGVSNNVTFRNLRIESPSATAGMLWANSTTISNIRMIECAFNDTRSMATAISVPNTTTGLQIKRCTFSSAGAFSSSLAGTNTKFIGNNLSAVAGANSLTSSMSGNVFNSNVAPNSAILMSGLSSLTSAQLTLNGNRIRNFAHTGGSASFPSLIRAERNVINAGTGIRGFAVAGVTSGGWLKDSTISSLGDTGIGWPIDGAGATCAGHEISGNTVTNNGANGHAILVSSGGSSATLINNTTAANGGGAYGIVLKGSQHTIQNNTFTGGSLNGMLLKGVNNSVIRFNTVNSSSGIALEFDDGSANNTVRDNVFNVSGGTLYTQALADIGTGNQVNTNTYVLTGSATWGSLLGATVNSLSEVRARWSSQYPSSPSNDSTSTAG